MQETKVPSLLRFIPKMASLLAIGLSLAGGAGAQASSNLGEAGEFPRGAHQKNPARLTDRSRSADYNDFLRVVWVGPGRPVTSTTLGRRAFFTASTFFNPPVTVDELLAFVGNYFHEGQDFVVMRCKPSPEQRANIEPLLATWPNVFPAIASDLGGENGDCSAPDLNQGEREICRIASRYEDTVQTVYDVGLAQTLRRGARMFATPESTEALRTDYGIFPAFTGLGFAVKGSAMPVTGATVPMTTGQVLRNSVVPEYLLKKADLADAGCRCLQVPSSERLHDALVDPDVVWAFGELQDGACRRVGQLDERAVRP